MWKIKAIARSTSDLSPKHQTSEISLKTSDLMLKYQTWQHCPQAMNGDTDAQASNTFITSQTCRNDQVMLLYVTGAGSLLLRQ